MQSCRSGLSSSQHSKLDLCRGLPDKDTTAPLFCHYDSIMKNNNVAPPFQSKVIYLKKYPKQKYFEGKPFFIIDQRVFRAHSQLRQWVSAQGAFYLVKAGEDLKNIDHLAKHLKNIITKSHAISPREMTLVAIGGGSVGDFAGFVASIFKRGVRFVQIPSTWLAALDSSHGGKNALNIGNLKNQVGTFYFAKEILIVQELLYSQPERLAREALGEVYKTVLLSQNPKLKKLLYDPAISRNALWSYLPPLIEEKYRIVNKDPLEKGEMRFVLNLGHTVGHVLELEQNLSHGAAVAAGLKFALWLSCKMKYMTASAYKQIQDTPLYHHLDEILVKAMRWKRVKDLLLHDKKRASQSEIKFVFIKKIGTPWVGRILVDDLLHALVEFGWIQEPHRK